MDEKDLMKGRKRKRNEREVKETEVKGKGKMERKITIMKLVWIGRKQKQWKFKNYVCLAM